MSLFLIVCLFSSCDQNNHNASEHPCNFPDAETENNLTVPLSFKILDRLTLINLVDTTASAKIHIDSVHLYDEQFNEIPQEVEYWIDNWTFKNFEPYIDVPLNDPQALLDLEERTFYLRTSIDDIDTINVYFEQCLLLKVLFNGQSTIQPQGEPYDGYASLYFLK